MIRCAGGPWLAALPVTGLAAASLLLALFAPRVQPPPVPDGGRSVVDMSGRQAHLPASPQAVAVLARVLSEYVTVDGTDAHIGAVGQFMKDNARTTLLGKLFPGLLEKEARVRTGSDPMSVEQMLLEAPDAVLCHPSIAEGLDRVGLPGVVRVEWDPSPGTRVWYRLFADVAGKPWVAPWIQARYRRQTEDVLAALPADAVEQRVVVVTNEDFMIVSGWDRFNADLRTIKARNPAAGFPLRNAPANLETLLAFDPDLILLPPEMAPGLTPERLYTDRRLAPIRAVRDRRVYRMPNGASFMDGPVEAPLLMQWLAELAHPRMQPLIPLRDAIRNAYREVYGYEMSELDIDTMLQFDQNASSAGHERFARSAANP